MTMGIRFVAEYYNIETKEVVESEVLRADKVKRPSTLKELGYLHEEQIQLIKSIQDFKILYETKLINDEVTCPDCGGKTSARGTRKSNFHAALTDHKVNIQRRRCKCGWSSPDTVESIYASSLHPDLVEKQAIPSHTRSRKQLSPGQPTT